jgi:hypothetical protein
MYAAQALAAPLHSILINRISDYVRSRPRDVQQAIGPSEVGEPCSRALIARLMNVPQRPERPNWKAEVGTAIHEDLKVMFGGDRDYIVESPVTVGFIDSEPVTGTCDLFHIPSGTVVDWKSKGRTTMTNHKRKGPGPRYETQAQLYGLGYVGLGYEVKTVQIEFLPRDGELADGFGWAAPFQPLLGLAALDRCHHLLVQAREWGLVTAMNSYPHCDDDWCRTCNDPNKIYPGRARVSSADNPFALNF